LKQETIRGRRPKIGGAMLCATAGLLFLVAGCAKEEPKEERTLLIGFLTNFEDISSTQGRTAQLLVPLRAINEAGGLTLPDGNYNLDLAPEDHGSTPLEAGAALERLAALGVTVVVGPPWSSLTLGEEPDHSDSAVAKAKELGMVLISGSATAEAISTMDDDDLMWRTVAPDTIQAKVAAQRLIEEEGVFSASILYREDAWGTGLQMAFRREFEALGGEILGEAGYPVDEESDPMTSDYTDELDVVFDGDPGAVYLATFDEALTIANQMVSGGYLDGKSSSEPILFGSDGFYSSDLPNNAPDEFLTRLLGVISAPDRESQGYKDLAALMEENGFAEGDTDGARHDALMLGVLGIQCAQSTDPHEIKKVLGEISRQDEGDLVIGVNDWELAHETLLAAQSINYEGASGPIEFNEDGDPSQGSVALWRVAETNEGYVVENFESVPYSL
jgi:branched-chain amino acid transport system substrate-binding protein